MHRTLLFLLTPFLSLLLAACSPSMGTGGTGGTGSTTGGTGGVNGSVGSVIIGLTSDLRVGVDIDSLHVVMRAGGAVIKDETLSTAAPASVSTAISPFM